MLSRLNIKTRKKHYKNKEAMPLFYSILILSLSVIFLLTLAGHPYATTSLGISLVTIEAAPITEFLPIVTPGRTTTFAPIHTFSLD